MNQKYRQAVFLGSTRGIRRLDATRSMPASLQDLEPTGTVLDWALHALASHDIGQITYIGGYQIQKVIGKYPTLRVRYHPGWEREGELAALLNFEPTLDDDCLVLRSSTVFLPEALSRLAHADGMVVSGHYESANGNDFVGIMGVSATVLRATLEVAHALVDEDPTSTVDQWLDALKAKGYQILQVDLDELAAPARDRSALARTLFGSKARTLARLQPLLKHAQVLDQVAFDIVEWSEGPEGILARVADSFGGTKVVVRSSAQSEDGAQNSWAGHFRSVLDIPADDGARLRDAVQEVTRSYSNGRSIRTEDEVFVQPQVSNLAASGVTLTRDPETGAPYYVINLDRLSGRSDTVTSGARVASDTVYVAREADCAGLPEDISTCLLVARELEDLMHHDALDIEWGINRSGQAYVFQVRRIAAQANKFELADEDLMEELESLRGFLQGHMQSHPNLAGRTTLFSTMSDWNPAEMIGTTPRPLALSLYQRLIGERSWSEARCQIGYRDVRTEPLMVSLGGRPYVDVRASLNSLLPGDLEPETAEKWVNHGLERLREAPHLHDKIEFEIALPCWLPDDGEVLARLSAANLSGRQIAGFKDHLSKLTDDILCGRVVPIAAQLASSDKLELRRASILEMASDNPTAVARQIYYLLEDCQRWGLVPFAVLARYAFVAMALMRSLRSMGIFTGEEYETVLRSVPTIATQLSKDLSRLASGDMTIGGFLDCYGHLRPSSYDITSPNYAAAPDLYLGTDGAPTPMPTGADERVAMELFEARGPAIDGLLKQGGLEARWPQVRDLVIQSIPAREWSKFQFMKSVNAALEKVSELGDLLGFGREDMSFLPLERILSGATASSTGAFRTQIRREIEFAKKRWSLTCAVRLPHLVRSPSDVDSFRLEIWTPNFVSSQKVVAPPIVLDGTVPSGGLNGRIVLVRAADPGYDWIFGHAIAGLVTQYGGVGSHMAIRAAEFGLPAAIGCGEVIFDQLRSARLIELDCVNRRVNSIA